MERWIEPIKDKYTLKLVTTGRKSGLKRVTTIWFGILDGKLYVSSGRGEKSDWVKNIMKSSHVEIIVGEITMQGIAKIAPNSNIKHRLRRLYWRKYNVLMAFAELSKILMRISLKDSLPVLIEIGTDMNR